jgi:hypothetical protein
VKWTAEEEQHWLQMLVAHQGMLRTAEHVGGALRRSDVEFIRAEGAGGTLVGAVLKLRQTKTSTGQRHFQQVVLPRRGDELDAVGPLWRLVAGLAEEGDPLFGERGMDRTRVGTSRELFIGRVRRWLALAGLESN